MLGGEPREAARAAPEVEHVRRDAGQPLAQPRPPRLPHRGLPQAVVRLLVEAVRHGVPVRVTAQAAHPAILPPPTDSPGGARRPAPVSAAQDLRAPGAAGRWATGPGLPGGGPASGIPGGHAPRPAPRHIGIFRPPAGQADIPRRPGQSPPRPQAAGEAGREPLHRSRHGRVPRRNGCPALRRDRWKRPACGGPSRAAGQRTPPRPRASRPLAAVRREERHRGELAGEGRLATGRAATKPTAGRAWTSRPAAAGSPVQAAIAARPGAASHAADRGVAATAARSEPFGRFGRPAAPRSPRAERWTGTRASAVAARRPRGRSVAADDPLGRRPRNSRAGCRGRQGPMRRPAGPGCG